MITVVIQGPPQGKQRARAGKNGAFYTPAETVNYENGIGFIASAEMRGKPIMQGPLHMDMKAVFAIPKSWSDKKRHEALTGSIRPTVTPDADNILKAIQDGMNGIVFKDDAQIVSVNASKVYGSEPFVVATIKPVGE